MTLIFIFPMISHADDGETGSFPVVDRPTKTSSQFEKNDRDQF